MGRFRVLALLMLVVAAGTPAVAAQTAADSGSVAAALERYAGLLRRQASDSIAGLFTDDGELVDARRPPIVGPGAIRAFLGSFSAYHVLADTMTAATLDVHGDSALQTGRYWQQVQLPVGDTVVAQGGFRILWLRDGHGGWRLRRMGTVPPGA